MSKSNSWFLTVNPYGACETCGGPLSAGDPEGVCCYCRMESLACPYCWEPLNGESLFHKACNMAHLEDLAQEQDAFLSEMEAARDDGAVVEDLPF